MLAPDRSTGQDGPRRTLTIVRARDSSNSGLATTNARHIARDTATFRRLRENRNSSVRGTSSALDVAIE